MMMMMICICCLCVCLSIYLCLYLSIYLSIYVFIYISTHVGGQSLCMSHRCCWQRTCSVTGMAGAFSASTSRNGAGTTNLSIGDRGSNAAATAVNTVLVCRKKNNANRYEYCADDDQEKVYR